MPDRKILDEIKEILTDDGIQQERKQVTLKTATEPDHFKLYDNNELFDCSGSAIKLFIYISMKLMSYAQIDDLFGGMTFRMSLSDKEKLMQDAKMSRNTFYKAWSELKEKKLIKTIDGTYYQVNPFVAGKGLYYFNTRTEKGSITWVREMWEKEDWHKFVKVDVPDKVIVEVLRSEIDKIDSELRTENLDQLEQNRLNWLKWKFIKEIQQITKNPSYEIVIPTKIDKQVRNGDIKKALSEDREIALHDLFEKMKEQALEEVLHPEANENLTEEEKQAIEEIKLAMKKLEQAKANKQATEASETDSKQFNDLLEQSLPEQPTQPVIEPESTKDTITTYKTNEDGFMTEIEIDGADPF